VSPPFWGVVGWWGLDGHLNASCKAKDVHERELQAESPIVYQKSFENNLLEGENKFSFIRNFYYKKIKANCS
jgi:hypothetical protein